MEWRQTQLSNKFDGLGHYEICYNDSEDNTWKGQDLSYTTTRTYCPPVNCANGLTFNTLRLRCETTQTITATEHRTIRDIKQSDYNLELPDIPDSTTPMSTTTPGRHLTATTIGHNKEQVKARRRLERKLKQIQEKGLSNVKTESKLSRKIYKEYNRRYGSNGNPVDEVDPGDIIIDMEKNGSRVTCKPIIKANIYMIPTQSHFLACAVHVP